MRYLLILLFVFLKADVYIASAANLTYVMPEIIKEFHKKYPSISVKLVLSSSGKLTAQIMHSAPYDIFLSANMKYPLVLYKKGFAKEKPVVYGVGKIIIFGKKSLDLLKANCIAITNPKTAPYGRAAIEFLRNSKLYDKVKSKLVFAESVSGVIPYVANVCDVGIVSKSMLFSKNIKNLGKIYYKEVSENLHSPIKQGIVLLSNKEEAKKFYEFFLSKKAKEILKKYGYGVDFESKSKAN